MASPLGYKLVEAYTDEKIGFRFVRDKSKAVELQKIEQEMLKNGEEKGNKSLKMAKSRSRTRSMSPRRRSRSRSSGRSSDKGKGVAKTSWGSRSLGACVWCGRDGHGYKYCHQFKADLAAGKAVYDVEQRKFVQKEEESPSSSSKRNRSSAGKDRASSRRRTRTPPRRR